MGLAPGPWRSLLLGLTTLMVAAVVSVAGVVAFVGLIAPTSPSFCWAGGAAPICRCAPWWEEISCWPPICWPEA